MTPPLKIKCRATSRRTGQPCQNWAVNGALVCRMHGAGGSGEHKNDPARAAKARIEDADTVLRERLFQLHEPALEALRAVLQDPNAKAADRLKAADTILNRFVPAKAEVKVQVDESESRDLDEEIFAAAGLEDPEADAG